MPECSAAGVKAAVGSLGSGARAAVAAAGSAAKATAKNVAAGASRAAQGVKNLANRVVGKCHSFAAGTGVLMADGSVKAIEDVEVGDLVTATDPRTNTTEPQPVTAEHLNLDRDKTDLTITIDGRQSLLETTPHHPFWNQTRHTGPAPPTSNPATTS